MVADSTLCLYENQVKEQKGSIGQTFMFFIQGSGGLSLSDH